MKNKKKSVGSFYMLFFIFCLKSLRLSKNFWTIPVFLKKNAPSSRQSRCCFADNKILLRGRNSISCTRKLLFLHPLFIFRLLLFIRLKLIELSHTQHPLMPTHIWNIGFLLFGRADVNFEFLFFHCVYFLPPLMELFSLGNTNQSC